MRSFLPLLLAVAACGNFSNEDLLFLAGVPRPHEVEMEVEAVGGEAGQALVGAPAELYGVAHNAAQELNGGVAGILALVGQLGAGYPPTERAEDSRVWGPVTD